MSLKIKIKKISKISIWLLFLFVILIFCIDFHVSIKVKDKTFNDVSKVPYNEVGLLLGTSKYQKIKGVNQFYKNRLDATVALFKAGKIKFILISGDNAKMNYNEPITMKNDLLKRGVPENKIFLDFAGFRTLDSVIRAKLVFQQNRFTIISQLFQNERALYIANQNHLDCVAFNAKEVDKSYGLLVSIREKFARMKMFLDFLLGVKPKFLGDPVNIK